MPLRKGYWKLKEEALDGTLWRTGFGKSCVRNEEVESRRRGISYTQ
jgi:hypothetical protein